MRGTGPRRCERKFALRACRGRYLPQDRTQVVRGQSVGNSRVLVRFSLEIDPVIAKLRWADGPATKNAKVRLLVRGQRLLTAGRGGLQQAA